MRANESCGFSEQMIEVAFPAWPSPVSVARVMAPAAPRSWAREREAGSAAAIVAALVAVPALAAVGAVLAMFVVTLAVLVAPAVAIGLAWVAWRCNESPRPLPGRA
jgi:hypothetical protein